MSKYKLLKIDRNVRCHIRRKKLKLDKINEKKVIGFQTLERMGNVLGNCQVSGVKNYEIKL